MLEENLIKWLKKENFEYFKNFALGGKFPDMIAVKESKIIAFEMKSHANEIPTAMGQCLFYLNSSNKVYIVLPKEEEKLISSSAIETLRENGIGLIIVNDKVNVLIDAKEFKKDNLSIITELKNKKKPPEKKIKIKIDVRKKIIENLKNHPEGLTAVEISKYIGMSRHSITKYVYQLLGEDSIYQRKIGTAKLCFLKVKR